MLKKLFEAVFNILSKFMEVGLNKSLGRKVEGKKIANAYYFQLKNTVNPYTTCFPSTIAMLLSSIGIKRTPDQITKTVNGLEYKSWAKKNVWKAYRFTGKLNVVWSVEKHYLENTLKKNNLSDKFEVVYNSNTKRKDIRESIEKGFPVAIDTYPYYTKPNGKRKKIGHIVLVVDYKIIDKVAYYVIDDPFGSMKSEYYKNVGQALSGDDVAIKASKFDRSIRGKLSLRLCRKTAE